jgi:1-acyl-sn-glycerol-3-phosphate acyltransferase
VTGKPTSAMPGIDLSRGTLRGLPFRAVRAILIIVLAPLLRLKIEGLNHVPRSGPVIVVGNHLHNADPVLVSIAFPRPLHFMAKKELFAVPVIGWLIRRVGAFPIDRGTADRAAIRRAEMTLTQEIAVGIFPEGTRSTTGSLRQAYPGASLLALRSGVPILPFTITGSERLPLNGTRARTEASAQHQRQSGVHIRFGAPFTLERELEGHKQSAAQATDIMMATIATMLPPEYRGAYTGLVSSPPDGSHESPTTVSSLDPRSSVPAELPDGR